MYESQFTALPGLPPTIRVEIGTRSGRFPTQVRTVQSLVAETLREQLTDQARWQDLDSFTMTFLHYGRTFIEKLFTLHSKVVELRERGRRLGRDARHYSDLFVLAGEPEVLQLLDSPEFAFICNDQDRISKAEFADRYHPLKDLRFTTSEAFFIPTEIYASIEADYREQCDYLYYEAPPNLKDVLGRLQPLLTRLG